MNSYIFKFQNKDAMDINVFLHLNIISIPSCIFSLFSSWVIAFKKVKDMEWRIEPFYHDRGFFFFAVKSIFETISVGRFIPKLF